MKKSLCKKCKHCTLYQYHQFHDHDVYYNYETIKCSERNLSPSDDSIYRCKQFEKIKKNIDWTDLLFTIFFFWGMAVFTGVISLMMIDVFLMN